MDYSLRKYLVCIFSLLLSLLATAPSSIGVFGLTPGEDQALRDLKASIPNLANVNWFQVAGPCQDNTSSWDFLGCTNGIVTRLNLPQRRWTGVLPNSIGNLTSLSELILTGNILSGTLPASLLQLPLKVFAIEINNFESPIPVGLFNLSTLETIRIELNPALTEPWPLVWSPSIKHISRYVSGFTGPLPDAFLSMTNLETLDIRYSPDLSVNGSLPAFIFNLTSLKSLGFSNAGIDKFPDICQLPSLIKLDLGGNQLGIPFPNVSCLSQLKSLSLAQSGLNGTIPEGLPAGLVDLQAHGNQLRGVIPQDFGTKRWKLLSLHSNRLNGTIPAGIFNSPDLILLSLSSNELTGTIPSQYIPANLQDLYLYGNYLNGSIPETIGDWPNLSKVSIGLNLLTGLIPYSIGNLSLTTLDVSSNMLSGPIPTSLSRMNSLLSFIADHNPLNDSSSLEILSSNPNLRYIGLVNCSLSGTIPADVGSRLPLLQAWRMAGNRFRGSIPASIGQMSDLLLLDFEQNQLTGSIPLTLTQLRSISFVGLRNNSLMGCFDQPPIITSLGRCFVDPPVCGCSYAGCTVQQCPASVCPQPAPFSGAVCYNSAWIVPSSVIITGTNTSISSPTVISGNLVIQSENSTLTLRPTAATLVTVQGCITLSGSLKLNLNGSLFSEINSAGGKNVTLFEFAGFCDSTQTRFSNLQVVSDCGSVNNPRLEYSSTSLSLVFDSFDGAQCAVSSGISSATIGIIVGCTLGGILLIIIIVLILAFNVDAVGDKLMPWRSRRKLKAAPMDL